MAARVVTPLALVAILLICAAFGVGVLTEPRDENPYGCTCCDGSWATVDAFMAHRCPCERVR